MFKTGFIKLNASKQPEVKKPKVVEERGVVYLGHVPHGFYENEMKQYFSQFGDVTNINIPKSKKTGKARGFAFIEFLYPEVAKVVAETMNNYLMHKKILVAKYLPPDQVKSNTFWRCNKKNIPLTIKNRSILRKTMERQLNPEQDKKIKASYGKRIRSIQNILKSKGIEYEIQTYNPKQSEKIDAPKEESKIEDNDNNACSESATDMDLSNDSPIKLSEVKKKNKVKKTKVCKLKIKS